MTKPLSTARALLPFAVRVLWDSLSPKSRNSAAGRVYGAVIEALDAEGYASLAAILASQFPDDSPDNARRALATQFINRPPLDAQGLPPLRLKTDRIPGKGGESVRAHSGDEA